MWVITYNKFKSRICAIFTRADKMNYLLLIYFAYTFLTATFHILRMF